MQTTIDDRRETIVIHAAQLADGSARLADEAADLLAEGESMSGLARLLGISRPTATERFTFSLSREAATARRRIESWHGTGGTARLSIVGRFVVFYDGTTWRILRHCVSEASALDLAMQLGRTALDGERVGRFMRTAKDLDPEAVVDWALGPYALLIPEQGA